MSDYYFAWMLCTAGLWASNYWEEDGWFVRFTLPIVIGLAWPFVVVLMVKKWNDKP